MTANVYGSGVLGFAPSQAVSNGSTITPSIAYGSYPLTLAAAAAGVILGAGLYAGQPVVLINEAAYGSGFSLTFAAGGTSNVADGTADVIAAGTAARFTWSGSLWYRDQGAGGGGGVSLPLTTLGDTLVEDATPTPARLPGNTTTTRKFWRQVGTGSVSAVPAWDTLQAGDIPALPYLPESGGAMTGRLSPAFVALTDAATIAVDASLSNEFWVILGGSRTMGAPSNPGNGALDFWIGQPASGGPYTITWPGGAGGYDFGNQARPVLSTTAGAVDLVAFRYNPGLPAWCYMGYAGGF